MANPEEVRRRRVRGTCECAGNVLDQEAKCDPCERRRLRGQERAQGGRGSHWGTDHRRVWLAGLLERAGPGEEQRAGTVYP